MTEPHLLLQQGLTHNRWGLLGSHGYVLGVDIGGYDLRAVLVDLNRRTSQGKHSPLASNEPQHIVESALQIAQQLLDENHVSYDRLLRIGVGFGGPVDHRTGTIQLSPRMAGWENYPLQEKFENVFGASTLIDNDANLIALGEATFGIGAGANNLFYLHLSSGVGGGIVVEGRLYHGANATAGEIGHTIVGHGWNGVGQPATLEELVSINGLLRRAEQLGMHTNNLHDIFSDPTVGAQVVRETVTLLAMRLAQVVALLDPEILVMGGIVVRIGGDAFVEAIRLKLNEFIAPKFSRPRNVVASVLGFDSIAIGALALALESLCD